MTQELHGVISLGGTVIGGSLNQRGLKGETGDKGDKGDVNTYIAEYGTDSYADIGDAITEGKYVIAVKDDNYYPLIMFSNSSYVFSYIHENICHEIVCDSYSTWTARTHTSVRDVKQNGASVTTSGVALVTTPQPTTTTPKMDGTAAVGLETTWAKGDHVHPTDTSRVPTTRTVNGKALSSDITLGYSDVGAVSDGIKVNGYALTSDVNLTAEVIAFDDEETYSDDTVGKGIQDRVMYSVLEQLMPSDSAQGAIASFPDGQAVFPLKSCLVDIDPVQDLHGYDKPWSGGNGKNKLHNQGTSGTVDGVTYTVNSDGSVTTSGTSTGWHGFSLGSQTLPAGTYILSSGVSDQYNQFLSATINGTNVETNNGAKTFTLEAETTFTVNIVTRPNKAPNQTVYPMIRLSSVSDTTFEPYSNICPITGWTGCEVDVSGVNVWDGTWLNGYWDVDTAQFVSSANWKATPKFKANVGDSFYVSKDGAEFNAIGRLLFFNDNGVVDGGYTRSHFTIPSGYKYFALYTSVETSSGDFTIAKYSGTPSYAYHAYQGTTYPVSWQTEAGTVYGGTVDLVTGVLTAYPYYASYNGETLVGQWVSSMDEYIEGRTPTTGAQVVDFGGTPTTYQLTGEQIDCLLGHNNVWADCGDIEEVKYKADVQKWVEKQLREINTAILALS